ncbi:hypothetical protein Taro_003913 [Colocasia esculenta]|uniref:Reverse transcriptase zinc-binding domain-containing protein n=1 Tax=Colocasia esculenta TaxID=4460 RepID=A0A843TQ91_COLES|nr:hypothetical protein [Colocasia esculenta]
MAKSADSERNWAMGGSIRIGWSRPDSGRSTPTPGGSGPTRATPADPSLRRDRESRDCADRQICLHSRPLPPPLRRSPPSLPSPELRGASPPATTAARRRCFFLLPLFFCSPLSSFCASLPINVDDDEDDDDDDDPDSEFTAAERASRRSYAEEDDRRRGLGTSGSHLSRDDSRRSLPRSTSGSMDTYLYRSRSVKQPSIKQALKGVKVNAKAAKGAIKGIVKWFLHAGVPAHTTESPYFQTMLDAIAETGSGLKAPTRKYIYDAELDEESHAVTSLVMENINLSNTPDTCVWMSNANGIFSTSSAFQAIRPHGIHRPALLNIWHHVFNPRASIFGWRILHRAMPTYDRLSDYGIQLASSCSCCKSPSVEDLDHIFLTGELATLLWRWTSPLLHDKTSGCGKNWSEESLDYSTLYPTIVTSTIEYTCFLLHKSTKVYLSKSRIWSGQYKSQDLDKIAMQDWKIVCRTHSRTADMKESGDRLSKGVDTC